MRTSAILSLCLLVAAGASGQDASPPRTKAEVIARWEKGRPLFRDWQNRATYADLNSPFVVGEPRAAYIDDGLRMLNFLRYLAGMPDDARIDRDLNYKSQVLTAINTMNDVNSHDPERPEGMPKELYDIGFAVGHACNLQYAVSRGYLHPNAVGSEIEGWGPFPMLAQYRRYELARMTLDCWADSDSRNLAKIQHRRNLMRPEIAKVGYGYIDTYEEAYMDEDEAEDALGQAVWDEGMTPYWRHLRQYMASYVLDDSRASIPDYDYFAWPSRGYFPLQFWNYGRGLYPWSVTLNPAKYSAPDPNALAVELSDAAGSFKIVLNKTTRLREYGMIGAYDIDDSDAVKPFLHYVPGTAHWQPMIHFFPGENRLPEARAGDRYRVKIQGLKDRQGKAVTISYWVEFLDLPNAAWILEPSFDN
ncbi:MAG: hypothetical protein Q8M76_12255 [Spirochaetaceae bacterium]|nr:hypothetical protein [Spirochaetaceae bacterium]